MDFGDAIKALKRGERVARTGWNGRGMRLLYVDHCEISSKGADGYVVSAAGPGGVQPFIMMHTAQNTLVPWLASQTDMLAEDWTTVT